MGIFTGLQLAIIVLTFCDSVIHDKGGVKHQGLFVFLKQSGI